jgi:gliding motility-associated-like protein
MVRNSTRFLIAFFAIIICCVDVTYAQVYCPTNIDFEQGNLNYWNFYTASNNGSAGVSTLVSTAPLTNRDVLTSGTATDYYGGFPIVDPMSGSYSLRLGNDSVNAQVDQAKFKINVPSSTNNYSLIYRYAVVFENPSHTASDQPWFKVRVYDSATGAIITCASFTFISQSSMPGFSTSTKTGRFGGSIVYYKPWSTASLNLTGQAGKTLYAEFTSADCALGGHMGYGYVDVSCGLFAISASTCNAITPLTAPAGFQTYTWYNSNYTSVVGTGQSISVTTPSGSAQYHVILTPYTGYGCTDTLTTTITGTSLSVNGGLDTMVCNNDSIRLNAVASGTAPLTYSWTPTAGLSCTNCSNPWASPAATTAYVVTVTDSNGCSRRDTVNVIASPKVTVTTTSSFCYGAAAGAAAAVGSMGVPPYTYSWNTSPVSSTASITGLTAGTYTVTVTDSKGCIGSDSAVVAQSPPIVPAITRTVSPCSQSNNSTSITVSATGGVPGYKFAMDNGPYGNNGVFSSLASGTYTIHVKDSSGCIKDTTVTVVNPSPISISAIIVPPTCNGGSNGSITIVASGGRPPYQYAFGNGGYSTQNVYTGLSAGNYSIHVRDSNNCDKHMNSVTVSDPPLITLTLSRTNVLCYGDSSGTITATASGGNSGFTYSLDSGAYGNSNIITGVAAGTHTVTVVDSLGCPKSASITVTQPTALNIACTRTNATCYGSSNGAISVSGSGGTTPYQYAIGSGSFGTSSSFSGLAAGSYTVHIRDANNCVKDTTVNIAQPTSLVLNYAAIQPQCSTLGSVTVTGSGGVSPYLYAINNTAFGTGNTFSNLNGGTYVLHLKDANGCTLDSNLSITPYPGLAIAVSTSNVLCNGGNSGTITVSGSGGAPAYTFAVNSGSFGSGSSFTGLAAGTYAVHLKDANGCIKDSTVSLTQPAKLNLGYTASALLCNGNTNGTVTISGSGGATPYTFALNGGSYGNTGIFSGLSAGTYALHLKDANGCMADSNITIAQPAAVGVSASGTNVLCYGGSTGSVTLSGNGGVSPYTYAANIGTYSTSNVISGLAAGTYTLHVKDANGCIKDTNITITQPTAVTLGYTAVQPLCNVAGSVTISGVGGVTPYTYAINSGSYSTTAYYPNLSAGSYILHVKDANGCIKDSTIALSQPPVMNVAPVVSNVLCKGGNTGSVTITATNGVPPYTYALGNGAFGPGNVISGLSAGTYTLHVKDANGCITDSGIVVTEPSRLLIGYSVTNPLCSGSANGSISISGSGGTPSYTYALNSGSFGSSGSFPSVGIGTYVLHLKDANGCIVDSTISIAQPTPLVLTLAATPVICNGGSTGTVTVGASGGTAPYQYAANSGGFTGNSTLNGLAAGAHVVHVKDAHGCLLDSTINITEPAAVGLTYTSTQPLCNGAGNGSISITGNGGIAPYNYSLNNSPWGSSGTFSSLAAGNYVLHVRDANNCVKDSNITLGEPTAVSVTSVVGNVLCNSGNSGSVTLTASGGVSPYTYAIGSGAYGSSNVFNGLSVGTYVLHVKDANGCIKNSTVTITQPTSVNLGYTLVAPLCYGATNGSITMSGTGGTSPYTYALNSGSFGSSASFPSIGIGTYVLHLKDANGCTKDSTISISQPTSLVLTLATTPVICNGGNTGTVTIGASGGTTPYQYAANSSAFGGNSTLTGLTAGTHVVHVKDANGCMLDSTISITEPAAVGLTYTSTQPLCNGGGNGSISVTGNGGIAPYTYALNSGGWGSSGAFSSLAAGNYVLHVRDANNCVKDSNITLGEPTAVNATAAVQNVLCNGGSTGSVTLSGTGGISPYTYAIGSGAYGSNNVFNALSAGTYTLHVKDANGCVKNSNITITQPAVLGLGYSVVAPLCFGATNGSITMTGTGGTTPFTYAINGGAFSASSTFGAITTGSYVLHLKDANGCTADSNITIAQPTPLSVSLAITDVLCYGGHSGTVAVTASGGTTPYQYAANGNPFGSPSLLMNLLAGANTIHLIDAHGCTLDTTITLTQPQPLSLNYTATQPLCHGANTASVAITGTGGVSPYTYSVNTGAFGNTGSFANLYAGTHALHVKDANGCTKDSIISIAEPAVLGISLAAATPSCHGYTNGSITVYSSGGTSPYVYAINNSSFSNSNVFSGLGTGTYALHIIDAHGCVKDTTIVLAEPTALTISDMTTPVTCHGGSNGTVQINTSGGTVPYSFSWTGLSQTGPALSGLSAGTYVVTVTDAKGCTISTGAYVSQPAALLGYASSTAPQCYNTPTGSATVSAYGGIPPYSYSWSTAPVQTSATAVALNAGIYSVTIKDSNNCILTLADTIRQTPPATIRTTSADVKCAGGADGWAIATVISPTSTYTYSWSTTPAQNNAMANGLKAGTYVVSATSAIGCIDTAHVIISQPNKLAVTASATPVCPGGNQGTVQASASGGRGAYSYTWYTKSSQPLNKPTGLPAGTYMVVVSDSVGCTDTGSATVISYNTMSLIVGNDQKLCEGSSVRLYASGARGYQWSPAGSLSCSDCDAPYAAPVKDETYTVVATDSNGCKASAQVHVTVTHHQPVAVEPKVAICEDQDVRLGASGGVAYQWLPPVDPAQSMAQHPTVHPTTTTTYAVVITENECFKDTLSQEVEVSPKPTLSLGADIEVSIGTVVTLKAEAKNATQIVWAPATGLNCTNCFAPEHTVTRSTTYVATVQNDAGCIAVDTINIRTLCDEHYLYFANAFTPNADGQNDKFYPQGVEGFPIQTFMIYDRWGEVVFAAHNISVNDPGAGWDGTFKGLALKPDVYIYVVDAICADGRKVVIRGDISLIR